jgi:hypothetical protein
MDNKVSSVKCAQCGLLNFTSSEVCKRCGTSISRITTKAQNRNRIPLIECPACEASISSQASSCPRCGQPLAESENQTPLEKVLNHSPIQSPPLFVQKPAHNAMNCSQCGSDSTITFEMAHASGTSTGRMSGLTYTPHGGLGSFGGKTTQQTNLAARTSPPLAPNFLNWLMVLGSFILLYIFIAAIVTNSLVGFLIFFGGLIGLSLWRNKKYQHQKEQHRLRVDAWLKSVICMRCGFVWVRR